MSEWGPVILVFGLMIGGPPGRPGESVPAALISPDPKLMECVLTNHDAQRWGGVERDHEAVDLGDWRMNRADTIAKPADRWFAEDKLKHFFTSLAATSIAHGGVRLVGIEGEAGLITAGTATAALGLWKEWRDARHGGPFSYKDLAWDGLGIALGLMIAAETR